MLYNVDLGPRNLIVYDSDPLEPCRQYAIVWRLHNRDNAHLLWGTMLTEWAEILPQGWTMETEIALSPAYCTDWRVSFTAPFAMEAAEWRYFVWELELAHWEYTHK